MLARGGQTQLVEAGERGEIGCGEGRLGHVEVFRDGDCGATSILGGLDLYLGMRRAGLGWAGGQGRLHAQRRRARKETALAFMTRAIEHFASLDVTIAHFLTNNESCYRSGEFGAVLVDHGIAHKKTRPYRSQANGKVGRFNRTAAEEWSYARPYTNELECVEAYPGFLRTYNHEPDHTATNGSSPASRVTNLPGQNI